MRVAGVLVDAVEEIRLFVVIGGEDYVVDNSLESLWMLARLKKGRVGTYGMQFGWILLHGLGVEDLSIMLACL